MYNMYVLTVKSRKFEAIGTRDFILKEVDIKYINPENKYYMYHFFFFQSNTRYGHIKEKPQGDISFMHPKHMLLKLLE